MRLSVSEIFYSLQGESLYAGLPCAFVRLAGCNLRCRYCDTTYAYEGGAIMEIPDIINKVESFNCQLIEVTGGEPLLQKNTPALVSNLLDRGHTVLIETNGTLDIQAIDPRCIRIVDIKCPGSGESAKTRFSNFEHLSPRDQVKFVITDRADYEYARNLLSDKWQNQPPVSVLFSPAFGMLDPAVLAEWILDGHLPVRLQLQLHKILWPTAERGV